MSHLVTLLPAAHKHKPIRIVGIWSLFRRRIKRSHRKGCFFVVFTLKLLPHSWSRFSWCQIYCQAKTIYWFNTLLFSYLCLCYSMSNKLDYPYRRIFLNLLRSLIYTQTGFEASKCPKFFTLTSSSPKKYCYLQICTNTEARQIHWAFLWGKNKETQPTFSVHISPTSNPWKSFPIWTLKSEYKYENLISKYNKILCFP